MRGGPRTGERCCIFQLSNDVELLCELAARGCPSAGAARRRPPFQLHCDCVLDLCGTTWRQPVGDPGSTTSPRWRSTTAPRGPIATPKPDSPPTAHTILTSSSRHYPYTPPGSLLRSWQRSTAGPTLLRHSNVSCSSCADTASHNLTGGGLTGRSAQSAVGPAIPWSPTQPPSGNPRISDRSSDAVGASMQPRRLLVVESCLTGHAGWLAAAVGNQRQAMLVLALRVRTHRALGDLHPPRRRRESNGFLTRAVEGDGMRVR